MARVEGNISLMERMQSLDANPSSAEYAALAQTIKEHAEGMSLKAASLQRKLLPAKAKLGKHSPEGWYRALVPKMRYVVNQGAYGRAFQELEEDGVELDRLLGLMNTEINLAGNAMAKESLAILTRQGAGNMDMADDSQSLGDDAALPSYSSLSQSAFDKKERGVGLAMARTGSLLEANSTFQAVVPVNSNAALTTLCMTTNLDIDRPEDRRALLLLLLFCMWREAVLLCTQFGVAVLPFLHMVASPAANVSMLLSDNFILEDFLGRRYSLSMNHFDDWSVLDSLLKSRFTDGVAGFEKVHAGQYRVFSVDDPTGTALDVRSWAQSLGPRKRFRMSVVISGVRLTNLRCSKCGMRLRPLQNSMFSCPNSECGMFLQSLTARKQPSPTQWRQLARAVTSWNVLQVPHEATCCNEFSRRRTHFAHMLRSVDAGHSKLNDGGGPGDSGAFGMINRDWDIEARDTESLPPDDTESASDDEATLTNEDKAEDVDEPDDTLLIEEPVNVDEEKNEMRYFRSISIRLDTSLYDAAALGNVELANSLIGRGFEVDSNPGPLGTALVPAIFSHSPVLVRLFLDAHANPLLEVCEGHTPLSLATCYGEGAIFDHVLSAALKWSARDSRAYQRAVDGALFQSLSSPSNASDRIPTLLLAGANPLAPFGPDGSTSFGMALGNENRVSVMEGFVGGSLRDDRRHLAGDFLAELWSRHLLNDHEARVLYSALSMKPVEPAAEGWLLSCALNLSMNRADMLGKRVAQRLRGSSYFKTGSRDLGIMTLLAKEGMMYYPWQKGGRHIRARESVDGAAYRAALGLGSHPQPLFSALSRISTHPTITVANYG